MSVREAAERLRNNEYDDGTVWIRECDDGSFLMNMGDLSFSPIKAKDQSILAAAYLSEHPADDDEPVTEEWLRERFEMTGGGYEQGYVEWRIGTGRMALNIRWFEGMDHCGESFAMYYGGNITHTNPTRGDVRRLCAALGIELKENSNG